MTDEPTVCVKGLRSPFFAATLATGVPIPELAERFALPVSLLTDLGARVPHGLLVRVWDELAALTGDAFFGLTAAGVLGAPQLDVLDVALARSATLRELGRSFVRYQRLFHEANDAQLFDRAGESVALHRFRTELPRSRHFTEFILAMWVARMRGAVGAERMDPVSVIRFRHARPEGAGPYQTLFGPRVLFDAGEDSVSLPVSLVEQPLAAGDARTSQAFASLLDAELARLSEAPLSERVRASVVGLLREGASEACDVEQLARRLALSRRTLQRRLADEGTSFRDVVDAARRELAMAELARGSTSMTELAFLLGFSEHSAFSRAFRRWTGSSPALYARSTAA